MIDKIDKTYQPINGLAARVVYGSKVHFTPNVEIKNVYKNKPTILVYSEFKHQKIYNDSKKLIGKKFGRLTIVGVAKFGANGIDFTKIKSTANCKRWGKLFVCKCACGFYVKARRKKLQQNLKTQCDHCDYTQFLRNGCKWPDR